MATYSERRKYERFADRAEMVFAPAGSHDYTNATLSDCSSGGMCLTSRYSVSPGRDICVKMTTMRAVFDATVVWCRPAETARGEGYKIGIEYPQPLFM